MYEANVTGMDGYKNQFLTALQPKIDKVQERWLARGGKTTSLIGTAPENRIVPYKIDPIDRLGFRRIVRLAHSLLPLKSPLNS
jgi:hypothetical protein